MNKFLLHITSFVVIILFLFMGACHNHPQAPMLLEVEKIIEEQPDSALSILNKIENINQLSEKSCNLLPALNPSSRPELYHTYFRFFNQNCGDVF